MIACVLIMWVAQAKCGFNSTPVNEITFPPLTPDPYSVGRKG